MISLLQKQNSGLVDQELLIQSLGHIPSESYDRFRKGFQRKKCIITVHNGFIKHDDYIHNVSKLSLKFGHLNRGVGPKFVQFQGSCDLDEWFDPTKDWEIHAEVRISPKFVQLCPTSFVDKVIIDPWKYCNIRISFPGRRIRVEMQPFNKGHKYGLNLERYKEYMDQVEHLLTKYLNFAPLPLLEVIKFDLQQDHECRSYDGEHNRKLIYNMIGLQEYAIWREDKPEANHRKEAMFLTRDGLMYAAPSQELLANDANKIKEMINANKIYEKTSDYITRYAHIQRDFFIRQDNFNKEISGRQTAVLNSQMEIYYKQHQIKDEINNRFDHYENNLESYSQKTDDSLSLIASSMDSIDKNTEAISQFAESAAEAVHTSNAILMNLSDHMVQLQEDHKTWREIDRSEKLDILSTLQRLEFELPEITEYVQEYFEVTYQALYQFWNYNQNRNNQDNLDKNSRKTGQKLKKNDIDSNIVSRIISIVSKSPWGENNRSIIEKVTGPTKKINDALMWMRQENKIEFNRIKNAIYYSTDAFTND